MPARSPRRSAVGSFLWNAFGVRFPRGGAPRVRSAAAPRSDLWALEYNRFAAKSRARANPISASIWKRMPGCRLPTPKKLPFGAITGAKNLQFVDFSWNVPWSHRIWPLPVRLTATVTVHGIACVHGLCWVIRNITAKPRRDGPKTVRTAPYGAFGLRGKATPRVTPMLANLALAAPRACMGPIGSGKNPAGCRMILRCLFTLTERG